MKRRTAAGALVLTLVVAVASADSPFDGNFEDATLRIDYFHVGDAEREFVALDRDAVLFATRTGTTPARSNLGATWRRACARAGVPHVRLHDLRHVAQVFAAEAGATLPELMARLGHATPAAALVYLHARTERDMKLTAALAEAMIGERREAGSNPVLSDTSELPDDDHGGQALDNRVPAERNQRSSRR